MYKKILFTEGETISYRGEPVEIKLGENPSAGSYSWNEVCMEGKAINSANGELIEVTEKTIDNMITNFKNNVRGLGDNGKPMVDIDYDHKQDKNKGSKAAGWVGDVQKIEKVLPSGKKVKVMEMRPSELTPEAQEEIKNKAWKFWSVDYHDWLNPADNKFYKDVLFGVALTNRPAVKHLAPATLSEGETVATGESKDAAKKITRKENGMKKLLALLMGMGGTKLSETAGDDLIEHVACDKITSLSELVGHQTAEITQLKEAAKKDKEDLKTAKDMLEKVEKEKDAALLSELVADQKKCFTPAEVSDPKQYFNVLLSEKKYDLCKNILADKGIQLKESKKHDEGEGEGEGEGLSELKEFDDNDSASKDKAVRAYMKEHKMDEEADEKAYSKAANAVKKEHDKKYAETARKKGR